MYFALDLCITWVSSIKHITNKKGDKLLPWKIPLLMLTFAKLSLHEVSCLPICHWLFSKFKDVVWHLHKFKASIFRNGESCHKPSYNQSMPFPDLYVSSYGLVVLSYWLIIDLCFHNFFPASFLFSQ